MCSSVSKGPLIKLEIRIGIEENIALHTFTAHSAGMLIGGILGMFYAVQILKTKLNTMIILITINISMHLNLYYLFILYKLLNSTIVSYFFHINTLNCLF